MKTMGLIALLLATPAYSMTDQDYQLRAAGFKDRQREMDTVLRKYGVMGPETKAPGSAAESEPALFQIHGDLSSSRLTVGKLLYGKTLTRLVIGPEGSPVLLELDGNQGALSGLRVLGVGRQAGVVGRIQLDVGKILQRSGRAIPFQAVGLDSSGAYGIEAQVLSGKAWAMAGAIGAGLISGFAAAQQTQTSNAFGVSNTQPGTRNGVLQGLAQAGADQSKRLIEEATAEKPVLILDAQAPVVLLIQEEVRF